MEKVTIEMTLHKAVVMLAKLVNRQKRNLKVMTLYASDGDPIPPWLQEDTDTLSDIIDTVERAINNR